MGGGGGRLQWRSVTKMEGETVDDHFRKRKRRG
jgi:hypothetical protein